MDQKQKTILVVEDEPAYQNTLAAKLGQEGFVVLTANNGEEGLAISLEKHPDLILLDLQMPKMGGIEMAKKLREDAWGKTANIIILTNASDVSTLEQAFEHEIFQYIVKSDTDLEALTEKIRDALT